MNQIKILANQNKEGKKYWESKLGQVDQVTHVPYDSYSLADSKNTVHSYSRGLGAKISNRLAEVSRGDDVKLLMVLVAGLEAFLHRYTEEDTQVLGTPVFEADDEGVNSQLILKNELNLELSFKEVLLQVREEFLRSYEHRNYPVALLRNPEKGQDQKMFDIGVLLTSIQQTNAFEGLKWNLLFEFNKKEDLIELELKFTNLYTSASIEGLVNLYIGFLEQLVHNAEIPIGKLNLIPQEQVNQLLYDFNCTEGDQQVEGTLHELFDLQVSSYPDQIAVVGEGESWTYRELQLKANSLAQTLRERFDIKRGDFVGVLIERTPASIVGILGILKAGAAYAPIDPSYPRKRIEYILEQLNPKLLMVDSHSLFEVDYFSGNLFALDIEINALSECDVPPAVASSREDLAYVIFTSGSTGWPKGVRMQHKSIVNSIKALALNFGISPSHNQLQFSPLSFDGSVAEIFIALTSGATLHLIGDADRGEAERFGKYLREHRIDWAFLPPAFIQTVGVETLSSLSGVVSVGDAAISEHANYLIKKGIRFINGYGPTEVAIGATTFEALVPLDQNRAVPIGKPLKNVQVYILNKKRQLCPVGSPGEIYVGGNGLSAGYLNDEEKTKTCFITFPVDGGTRLYKTGDLGRWLPDGNLEFLGRVDQQIKIRGFRVEIKEIENTLLNFSGILQAAVIPNGESSDRYLIAYLVNDKIDRQEEVKALLSEYLPDYMIPAEYVFLEELPLNANGKIDRNELQKLEVKVKDTEYVAPKDLNEEKLVKIWSKVLGYRPEEISVSKNFFELGGHSLKATSLVALIKKEFRKGFSLSDVFSYQTIREQIEAISKEEDLEDSIPLAEKQDLYLQSSNQRRLFFIDHFDEVEVAYNTPAMLEVKGEIDLEKFEKALNLLISRHEALRTSFKMLNDEAVQLIHPTASLRIATLERDKTLTVDENIRNFICPFDLGQAPLLRVAWLPVEDGRGFFIFDAHHIIGDGHSLAIIIRDYLKLLDSGTLEPLRIQYKDFSEWYRKRVANGQLQRQEQYWLDHFKDDVPTLNLSTDFPRPVVRGYNGSKVDFTIKEETAEKLETMAAEQGATMFMVLLSVFSVFLSKLSGQEDLVIGTPVSGREHPDTKDVVGLFVNTLALRHQLQNDMTFLSFLREVKKSAITAFENQEYQFEDLVKRIVKQRDMGRHPIFDVCFVFQNIEIPEFNVEGMTISNYALDEQISKFDLSLYVRENANGYELSFEYSTDLFQKSTIERFAGYFEHIVTEIAKYPETIIGDLRLIPSDEVNQVLSLFNNTKAPFQENKTIIDLFSEEALKRPDSIAVSFGERSLTYGELEEKSSLIAHYLINKRKVVHGQHVALFQERSLLLIPAILGIMKAGAVYIPIDVRIPHLRISKIIHDAQINVIITSDKYRETLDEISLSGDQTLSIINLDDDFWNSSSGMEQGSLSGVEENNIEVAPLAELYPEDVAYIIYTSGSTGEPKGVVITHRSVVNRLNWMQRKYPLQSDDVILQKTPLSFDVSIWELFWWFLNGASVALLAPEAEKDPEAIISAIKKHSVSTLHFVPSMLSGFLEYIQKVSGTDNLKSLETVFCSGEALHGSQVKEFYRVFKRKGTRLINLYGPTEATVDVTYYECEENNNFRTIPIGKPIDNTFLYVLNNQLQLQPIGVPGEIWISGTGVAKGYLNNPLLTSEKFLKDPFNTGMKMYRTGDTGKWLPDGNLCFLGRFDHQVKIKGHRVELGEIETVLRKHEKVREAAVVARNNEFITSTYLAAYIQPDQVENEEAKSALLEELFQSLQKELPAYMVPLRRNMAVVESFPLTANGKMDRKSLPEIAEISQNIAVIEPVTKEEELLLTELKKVLGLKGVQLEENFFQLGGDSIKAIQLISRLGGHGYTLAIKEIFQSQNIKELSGKVRTKQKFADQATITGQVPLTPIKHRFFSGERLDLHHFNHAFLLKMKMHISKEGYEIILRKLMEHHDSLRMKYEFRQNHVDQILQNESLEPVVLYNNLSEEQVEKDILTYAQDLHRSFQLEKGPLIKSHVFHTKSEQYLLIICHHLVVDNVSWRILLEDLDIMCSQYSQGKSFELPSKTDSIKEWSLALQDYSNSWQLQKQLNYWTQIKPDGRWRIPVDHEGSNRNSDTQTCEFELTEELSQKLLLNVNHAYGTNVDDILIAALSKSLAEVFNLEKVIMAMEGHGREAIFENLDISRTVGWFTTLYPVEIPVPNQNNIGSHIKETKDILHKVPGKGLGYGVLRYMSKEKKVDIPQVDPQVIYNFSGQFDSDLNQIYSFEVTNLPVGDLQSPDRAREFEIEVFGMFIGNRLKMILTYSAERFNRETIETVANVFKLKLEEIIVFCSEKKATETTASDMTYKHLSSADLDAIESHFSD